MNPINGGPSQGIRNLNLAMMDMGVTREAVCLDSPYSPYLDNKEQLKIHAVGPGLGPWHYSKNMKPWLEANMGRFDMVIVNGLWTYHSYAAIKVFNKLKKRSPEKMIQLFVMPNGMLDPYFQRAKERRLKAIRNWVYWKLVERNVVNKADGLLFTCETELLLARETFSRYKPKKEYNVGYGVASPPVYNQEMSSAFSAKCPGLGEAPYLLFLSRIHQKKGVDLLIEAYKQLYTEFKANNKEIPKLVIAGPGLDTQYGKSLQKQLESFPEVKASVFFPGMLEGDAKWGAFYNCQAFVLPSHQENFGIAVAEALACGKPVLISNQVNIWREIESDKGGIIKDDTMAGTLSMLREWLNMTNEEQMNMGRDALKTYHNHFTILTAANKLITILSLQRKGNYKTIPE
ncbi:glycosyltransferase [Mucilaginibacter sp. RCC_168]|uniref:glycosyltransferase n=1 Tax=Mucilaginibacter sp. RCC_168 TaxID=3239221 RepID=UPI003524F4B9